MSLIVHPVWWDAKKRKMIFNPDTVSVGILVGTDDVLSYVVGDETVFALARTEIRAAFKPIRMFVDITGPYGDFRLCFWPPVKGVPRLRPERLERVADLIQVGNLGQLVPGVVGELSALAGPLEALVAAPVAISDTIRGRRNFVALRSWLSQ